MPSEQRLHPASLLFAFAASLKAFALPALLAFLSFGRASDAPRPPFGFMRVPEGWEVWLMLLLIPSGLAAVARYLSFRLRYEDTQLVIRSGILFRNVRHIPYERIQNLEAVQNLVHRLLGVVEVRVETGAGREPEASISVLPASALPDMRRRVFAGREAATPAPDSAPSAPDGLTLLRLPLRELLLCGFLENRGLVVVGAIYGLVWETGMLNGVWERVFENESYTPGLVRATARTIAEGQVPPLPQIGVILLSLLVFLLLVRLLSMGWAVVRLYGFHLSRVGEDLRSEFGLMTRVSTTIPLRRVQTMTVREGPLYRLARRVSVRVETAGGSAGQATATSERQWVAPLLHPRDLPALAREVLPGADLTALVWQPLHPRAFRRAIKPTLLGAVGVAAFLSIGDPSRLLVLAPVAAIWAAITTYQQLQRTGWAESEEVVAFRSGWLWRTVTVARLSRIQVVTRDESPFDRRTGMARVRVDTAASGSHRVDIPFLPQEVATLLYSRLAAAAAATAFRW
jgi:putative membrane protein